MPVAGAIIGGVASIAGGAIASSGASKAANTQAQAARDAAAAQERAAALALEAQKTGNAEAIAAAQEAAVKAQAAQEKAAAAAQEAYQQSYQDVGGALQQSYQEQLGYQRPYQQAGLTAQQQMMQLLGIGGDQTAADYGAAAKPFGMDQFQQDPGYAFRQSEGMRALERSAAARQGLLSGSALKGIQRFGQDLASQEYQNAFNRYQTERAARLAPLQSMTSSGQSAANLMSSIAGQYGAGNAANIANYGQQRAGIAQGLGQTTAQNAYNVAQAVSQGAMNIGNAGATAAYNVGNAQAGGLTDAAAARASGYVGGANALGGALSSIGQAAANYPLYQAQTNYLNNMNTANQMARMSSYVPSVNAAMAANSSIF